MPVMIEFPIAAASVPRLDGVLVTHSDNDHYSVPTCRDLARVTREYHSTQYVASLMKQEGSGRSRHRRALRHRTGARGRYARRPRLAERIPGRQHAHSEPEDACGFWIDTPTALSGRRAIRGSFPTITCMPAADAMLFDFSDSEWHFGSMVIAMANAYPHTPLLLYHWGCVDAPDFAPFNADRTRCRTGSTTRTHPAPGARRALRPAATGQLINYVGPQAGRTSFATMIADMARGHPRGRRAPLRVIRLRSRGASSGRP